MKAAFPASALVSGVLAAAFASLALLPAPGAPPQAAPAGKISKQQADAWMEELSNWGRWGEEDELGTVNLITGEKRREAAALIQEGVTVSLARNAMREKAPDNPEPFVLEMPMSGLNTPGQFCVDRYAVLYHGFAHTHMDSICHMFYRGKMYNGFDQTQVTAQGAGKLDVTNYKQGIFTRAVLMDLPRLQGEDYLEPGAPIYPEDLDAWLEKAGIEVRAGDAVLIRTGRWARRAEQGPWEISNKAAGLYASCARWLRERDAAILGSDAASDVLPSGVEGVPQPIHQLVLIAMGMPILDNCDLERAAREAARRNRWEFALMAAPLAVPGGTGSPINPIAIF